MYIGGCDSSVGRTILTHRVEAEGGRMVLRDTALSLERQIEQINEMLDMGIELLILTPVDVEGLNEDSV